MQKNTLMQKTIQQLVATPRKLLLIDGVGALFTAIMLFIISKLQPYFGLPTQALNYLSGLALAFSLYSLCCYAIVKNNYKPWLAVIAVANMLYCILTWAIIIIHWNTTTPLAVIYFLGETSIIVLLVYIELKFVTFK